MARTGYKVVVYLDDNPLSPTYMQTYEEKVYDSGACPVSTDDLVLISSDCEVSESGYTGYRIEIYYNNTTGEYLNVREADLECEPSSSEEMWVTSGDPFCETTAKGINTGYMLQLEVQMNQTLSNYGEQRYTRYKSPDCGDNSCPIWSEVSKSCNISVIDCVATFDGTSNVVEIDDNPLSTSYNMTRTVNKEDTGTCENCTSTVFSWVYVGDMCGDDELLCSNGIQHTSTNSYTVSQKYKTIGSGSPIPMDEYQVTLKTEDDDDCGYIKPIYKWEVAPGQYMCDYETYTKYQMEVKMVSYDSGVTWSYSTSEPRRGEVIAQESYDCGKPMYRWIPNGEFVCVDNGDDGKITFYTGFENGEFTTIASRVDCGWDGTLKREDYSGLATTAFIRVGDCISEIYNGGLMYLGGDSYSALWLGNYTESIGESALQNYDSYSLDIPERVTNMERCFSGSNHKFNFRTIIMHPETPPNIGENGINAYEFTYGGDAAGCCIFVPADSYDLYAEDENFSRYVGVKNGRLLPMNNDTDEYKVIMRYKSNFTEFSWFVPIGESDEVIKTNELPYGKPILTSVTFTDTVKTIETGALGQGQNYSFFTKLHEIHLGRGVETIGDNVFSGHSCSELYIPGNVKTIGSNAFYNDNNYGRTLTSLTIENGVETISGGAFYRHALSSVTIPDSVSVIGGLNFGAFESKGNGITLKNIEIGSGCTHIGDRAFLVESNGDNVLTVTMKALIPPEVADTSFSDVNYSPHKPTGYVRILVPCEAYEDYISDSNWSFYNQEHCTIERYGCSGEEVTIAVLHQTDGTDVEITKPIEYRTKAFRMSDASNTSAITITSLCNKIIFDESNYVLNWTFNGIEPPVLVDSNGNVINSLGGGNDLQVLVPCNGYDNYIEQISGSSSNIFPIIDSSCSNMEYRVTSTVCDCSLGHIVDIEELYIDGVGTGKERHRDKGIVCSDITYSGSSSAVTIIKYNDDTKITFFIDSASDNSGTAQIDWTVYGGILPSTNFNISWDITSNAGKWGYKPCSMTDTFKLYSNDENICNGRCVDGSQGVTVGGSENTVISIRDIKVQSNYYGGRQFFSFELPRYLYII